MIHNISIQHLYFRTIVYYLWTWYEIFINTVMVPSKDFFFLSNGRDVLWLIINFLLKKRRRFYKIWEVTCISMFKDFSYVFLASHTLTLRSLFQVTWSSSWCKTFAILMIHPPAKYPRPSKKNYLKKYVYLFGDDSETPLFFSSVKNVKSWIKILQVKDIVELKFDSAITINHAIVNEGFILKKYLYTYYCTKIS